ncbi:CDC73-domain-containing protein [Rickenella mellea]|uniref:CDC73-domain-containing protein n=1 Tax=Rickenella mellea TaxID=50990 RepID=A0A4Y7PUH3_9AGAM|nr:CDC73-domain-containing protein [Rickenella mellea]
MSSPADPLLALRHAIKSKTKITYSDGSQPVSSIAAATEIVLSPNVSLPKSTPTRLQKPGTSSTDPSTNPGDFFTLEAVFLTWLLKDASGAEYMKQARESGLMVGFVSVTERKDLVEWLDGKSQNHPRIVSSQNLESSTPPGTPPPSGSALPTTPGHTSGSFASPAKRKYVVDTADADVVKKIRQNEVELRDRNTVLRGSKPNNFTAIRNVYAEKLKKIREASKGGATPAAASASKTEPKVQQRKPRNMYPIIMISSSPTSLITMHNVKRFLQDATFEPSTEARVRAAAEGNTRPEDLIAIYRKRTHIEPSGQEREIQARYFVVDGVEALAKFGNDAWDRVVAVVTTGQAWQFRPYKWTEPRTLFHHVKGFYVSWSNDPPNPKIRDWNVTELKIDPHRRHVDKSVVAHFWKTLDTWTLANKPWLMKS